MKVIKRIESQERCAEAGWYAYDFILAEPITEEEILRLRPLGSFLYLSTLKKPFFKIENHHYFIKGILGDDFFRVAIQNDYPDLLDEIQRFVERSEDEGEYGWIHEDLNVSEQVDGRLYEKSNYYNRQGK